MKVIIKPPEEFLEDVAFMATYDGPGMPDIWCDHRSEFRRAMFGPQLAEFIRNTFVYYDKSGDKVVCEEELVVGEESKVMKTLGLKFPPLPLPGVKLVKT